MGRGGTGPPFFVSTKCHLAFVSCRQFQLSYTVVLVVVCPCRTSFIYMVNKKNHEKLNKSTAYIYPNLTANAIRANDRRLGKFNILFDPSHHHLCVELFGRVLTCALLDFTVVESSKTQQVLLWDMGVGSFLELTTVELIQNSCNICSGVIDSCTITATTKHQTRLV